MKICIKCKEEKDFIDFPKRKDSKDGYRNSCKMCEFIKCHTWRTLNSDRVKSYNKTYSIENKSILSEYKNIWFNNRMKTDPLFKVTKTIKTSIKDSFRKNGYKKESRTHDILGCSFEEFKTHLESKFEDWMSWNNHGLYNGNLEYGWDIDHIVPVSSGKTKDEIIKLNHYTNLQPLCSYTNRHIKTNKLNYGII